MAKVIKLSSKKQDNQTVPANPFMRIDLFPGFIPSKETIEYVDARFGGVRQKPHSRMRGHGMSVCPDTIEDAKAIAAELVMKGLDRGEIEFTPGHPLVVTTDRNKVGDMGSFEMDGKQFYIGFE